MPYTDVTVNDLIVNVLTQDEYDSIQNPSNSELYLITDDSITPGSTSQNVATEGSAGSSTQYARADHIHAISGTTVSSALGYTPYNGSTNPNGYQTQSQVNSLISTAIGGINSFEVEIVQTLPTQDIDTHTIYMISNSGSGTNVYDEYMYINNAWEKIGTTETDLSEYAKTFIVTLTYDSQTGTYSADKTYAQISTALSNGYYVMVYDGSYYYPYTFTGYLVDDRHISHNFISTGEYSLTSDLDIVEKGWYISSSNNVNPVNKVISVPETTSDLLNDSGFITSSDIPVTDVKINNTSILSSGVANLVTATAYNASTNKIATESDIPEDKLFLVTATMSGLTAGTSDKSVTEIAAAVAAGKFVYIKTTVGTTTITAPLMHVVDTVDVSKAVFNYDDQQNSSQLYHAVLEITGTTVTITWTNEKYARESQIPDSTSDLTNDSGFITAATAPVTSVNSQTGDVVLTIPTATSDLTNDSGFITTIPAVTATGVLSFTNLNDVIEITHDTPAASDPEKLVSAVYPITIDSYGHITTAGSAVTIPSEVTESTVSGWGFTKNAGTVTSVTASGALTSSGGATPAITHNAPATSPAKGTQAVYPVTIDSYGHILSAGSAVTIPSNVSSFTNDAGYLTLATLPIYNGEVS